MENSPIKPDESDCCNSGCNPCILDIYQTQIEQYKASIQNINREYSKNCLLQTAFAIFKLIKIENHTKNCNFYTFEYVKAEKKVNEIISQVTVAVKYDPGQYFLIKSSSNGKVFHNAYTPIFVESEPKEHFTILVKLYKNGRMSRIFKEMHLNDETLWRGPYGDFKINYSLKNILIIAQGTGIAPFYTIICNILKNEECYTFLTLFFCCDMNNILFRDQLYELGRYWNFKYELFISNGNHKNIKEKYNEIIHFNRLNNGNVEQYIQKINTNKIESEFQTLLSGREEFIKGIKEILKNCCVSEKDIIVF